MKVLLCGADGFLGRALAAALFAHGHTVLRAVHHPRQPDDVAIDYRRDVDPAAWLPRLAGVDAVINAVGVLRERQPGDFERLHHLAPAALFAACAQAGVGRALQISALGAQRGTTAYLASKARGDAALCRCLPGGVVLRPALVFGAEGASTRFFLALASLPVLAVPRACDVQPVHAEDLALLAVRVLEQQRAAPLVLEVPGPEALPFAALLAAYRKSLGLAPALQWAVPGALFGLGARIAGRLPGSLFTPDTWAMLAAGNTGDPAPAGRLLGRPPRAPAAFVDTAAAPALREAALAVWRAALLRAVLASIWALTAWLSIFVWPWSASLALLAAFGLGGAPGLAVLFGAAALDLGMAVLTVLRPGRRLWMAQLGLILAYSALIAWRLPEFLIHPFGPVLKNLAVAAVILLLWAEESRS
ncbi:SDR family oxidoreductase [Pseudothauera nasutitermitis]|uniref:SDR family oxidoreductase n=1 Tax=Pseudothauera nasutitermitis TaxID=2565930 RepID=A0A4S4ARL3_9RHOO|nr:SDR family oxidoreductase [Pseudothauera nasutitermitis]THF61129.1 SDR family oxidoreductase [Pseudothauera nasutitermitis]